jgi:hypothetical protein
MGRVCKVPKFFAGIIEEHGPQNRFEDHYRACYDESFIDRSRRPPRYCGDGNEKKSKHRISEKQLPYQTQFYKYKLG